MSGQTDARKDQAGTSGSSLLEASSARMKKAKPFKRTYFGLGLWNAYFICKFALAYAGYLRLDLLLNAGEVDRDSASRGVRDFFHVKEALQTPLRLGLELFVHDGETFALVEAQCPVIFLIYS